MNEVLGGGAQPEKLLLEAVEAPWKEVSSEESSDEGVVVCAPLKSRGPAPKRTREEVGGRKAKPSRSSSKGEGAGSR